MTELFTDEFVRIHLASPPASKGHLLVLPKKNVSSLLDLSEQECVELFYGASYAATALFELLGAQGTNMLITNDAASVAIQVIARYESDGLSLLWEPSQPSPAELDQTASAIKDVVDELLWAKKNPSATKKNNSSSFTHNTF